MLGAGRRLVFMSRSVSLVAPVDPERSGLQLVQQHQYQPKFKSKTQL
jgi:hypothetical protein